MSGNHDITLDEGFYAEYGLSFHNQYPQDSRACIELFNDYPSITYLNHESAVICLTKEGGPRTTFKIFGSPFSPANGLWAFGYLPEEAEKLWEQVPLDADIVLTHTPPKYHCDESPARGAAGCESLRRVLSQVRPRLAVCGHIHEGRGAERVRWDLESSHVQFKELDTRYWVDPGLNNKKQCLVDLTTKGAFPLDNSNDVEAGNPAIQTSSKEPNKSCFGAWRSKDVSAKPPSQPVATRQNTAPPTPQNNTQPSPARPDRHKSTHISSHFPSNLRSPAAPILPSINPSTPHTATGTPNPAAEGWRLRRKETCVINAAIMAYSSRHAGGGGGGGDGSGRSGRTAKAFNKPIVVDVDLPVSVPGEEL